MKIAVKTIEGRQRRRDRSRRLRVRRSRPQGHPAPHCVVWQLVAPPAGHAQDQGPLSDGTARRCTPRRAPAGPPRQRGGARSSGGGGQAFGPVVRSHASDLPKKVRKLALRTALSAKAAEASWWWSRRRPSAAQDVEPGRPFRRLGMGQCAGHRRRRGRRQLRAARQHRPRRRAAGAGRQRLRHPASRHAGADEGRRQAAPRSASEMSAEENRRVARAHVRRDPLAR